MTQSIHNIQFSGGNPRRIILHWTAGTNNASSIDREHYHYIVEVDGTIVAGRYTVADNDNTGDGQYAAHTLNCNTGSIGIACAGMAGGLETKYPLSAWQVERFCELTARLCRHYNLTITPRTVLMHSEVQEALGIPQRGKIDLDWLTCYPNLTSREQVGTFLRKKILDYFQNFFVEYPPEVTLLYARTKTPAFLQDGTTLLPLRKTCLLREWTFVLLPDRQTQITIGENSYTLPYTIINQVAYISARKLADAMGRKLSWDAKKRQAVLR